MSLWIVGAGNVGSRVARRWIADYPEGPVFAETRTTERHAALKRLGARPRLREAPPPPVADNVLVATSKLHGADRVAESERALAGWSERGRFVFVSTTAVYAEQSGGRCTEASVTHRDARTGPWLDAEACVLARGGIVVRLAGLYARGRGPHRAFVTRATSTKPGSGVINLVHEEDAARCIVLALRHGTPGATYLVSDGHPQQRIAIARAALTSGKLDEPESARKICAFDDGSSEVGRTLDASWSRCELGFAHEVPDILSWLRGDASAGSYD